MPVSRTESSTEPLPSLKCKGDLALKREFESVGEKVQDDLLPHVAVEIDRFIDGSQITEK